MRSPEFLRNGEGPASPITRNRPRIAPLNFHSTVSVQKLRRFNTLILVFRLVTFCFSLASVVFMAMNEHSSSDGKMARWFDYDAFRYVLAANAIISIYSFAQMGASAFEILKGNTMLPETIQVWFDFSHDQGFAYLLLSANSAGTAFAQNLRNGRVLIVSDQSCSEVNAFCVQSEISIALGFAGFLCLAFSNLLSGFRVACYIISGSRFHL